MFHYLSGHQLGHALVVKTVAQARALFALYALGFTAIALEILLLNRRAWRLREALRLNPQEAAMTRNELWGWCLPVGVGLLSLVLALTLPMRHLEWSGWVFFSLALLVPLYRRLLRRRLGKST